MVQNCAKAQDINYKNKTHLGYHSLYSHWKNIQIIQLVFILTTVPFKWGHDGGPFKCRSYPLQPPLKLWGGGGQHHANKYFILRNSVWYRLCKQQCIVYILNSNSWYVISISLWRNRDDKCRYSVIETDVEKITKSDEMVISSTGVNIDHNYYQYSYVYLS